MNTIDPRSAYIILHTLNSYWRHLDKMAMRKEGRLDNIKIYMELYAAERVLLRNSWDGIKVLKEAADIWRNEIGIEHREDKDYEFLRGVAWGNKFDDEGA
jgi:hypothetical protein